jgi:hypothetical protein
MTTRRQIQDEALARLAFALLMLRLGVRTFGGRP